MARIREAVDAIEDREKEKADQERQRRKAKVQERKERRERGEKVTGPEPKEVEDKVNPKAQYNFTDPETPDPSPRQKMRNKLSTPQGRERYGLRKQTVEPVFGIIKEVMRFRQFLMRGQDEVAGEWNLVCCSYNLKRLFSLLGSRSLQLVAPAGRKTA